MPITENKFYINAGSINNNGGSVQRFGTRNDNSAVKQIKPTQDTDDPGTIVNQDVVGLKSSGTAAIDNLSSNAYGYVVIEFSAGTPTVGDVVVVTGANYLLNKTYDILEVAGLIVTTGTVFPSCPDDPTTDVGIVGTFYATDDLNRDDSVFVIKGLTGILNGETNSAIKPGSRGTKSKFHNAKHRYVDTATSETCGELVDEFATIGTDNALSPDCLFTILGCPIPKRYCNMPVSSGGTGPGGPSDLGCYEEGVPCASS